MMTEIEVSHLVRQPPVSVTMSTSRSVLWHGPSRSHHPSTVHRIGVCLGNITAIAILDKVVIQLMGCVLGIGDCRPGISISSRVVGRQLMSAVTVANDLSFPSVETSVDEGHVGRLVDYLTDARLMVRRECVEWCSLGVQRMMQGLNLEKMVRVFSGTRCSMTLLVEPLYIRATWCSLESVFRTLCVLPVFI